MPDTGAPWNIPYVAGTDLVRDWPTDSQELAEAIADALDDAGPAGIGTNVVTVNTSSTTSTTSTSFVDTALTAAITPTAATSKVLIIAQIADFRHSNAADASHLQLFRGTTSGTGLDCVTTSYYSTTFNSRSPASLLFLDSPATTSATTYTVGIRTGTATNTAAVASQQNMVLIEVAV